MSPEVQSPGLESVWAGESEKEVAYPSVEQREYLGPQAVRGQQPAASQKRRICGIRAVWFYTLLAAVIILAVGLGVGLGVGLWSRNSS